MSIEERLQAHRAALTGDFVPSDEAERFVASMEADHPDELAAWLREHAVRFVAITLGNMLRSERARARHEAPRRAFSEAAEAHQATGDTEPLSPFRTVLTVDDNNTRRTVADMTGRDHLYVASRYGATGNRALALAAFHRAVAKKVGDRRTADVLDEAQYAELERTITGGEAAA